ncbi:hypothetical protein OG558_32445 [Kribbella sp. NBC_01510]|uniref:hypothetical protein n=1 Tax=Kribbella sp. NBC_01510 TaxID=2903581 RepID=UPI003868F56A
MTVADEQVQARLDELRREYQVGDGRLRELLQQETALRETLLRISGAIQVLEELLRAGSDDTAGSGPGHAGDEDRRGSQVQSVS